MDPERRDHFTSFDETWRMLVASVGRARGRAWGAVADPCLDEIDELDSRSRIFAGGAVRRSERRCRRRRRATSADAATMTASMPSKPRARVVWQPHPPLEEGDAFAAAARHCPIGVHSAGKTQSRTEAHVVLQLAPEHANGEQSMSVPSGALSVCMPSHDAAAFAAHVPFAAQWKFVAQSASAAHDVPQAVPLQT
jgi:hypothetical protein